MKRWVIAMMGVFSFALQANDYSDDGGSRSRVQIHSVSGEACAASFLGALRVARRAIRGSKRITVDNTTGEAHEVRFTIADAMAVLKGQPIVKRVSKDNETDETGRFNVDEDAAKPTSTQVEVSWNGVIRTNRSDLVAERQLFVRASIAAQNLAPEIAGILKLNKRFMRGGSIEDAEINKVVDFLGRMFPGRVEVVRVDSGQGKDDRRTLVHSPEPHEETAEYNHMRVINEFLADSQRRELFMQLQAIVVSIEGILKDRQPAPLDDLREIRRISQQLQILLRSPSFSNGDIDWMGLANDIAEMQRQQEEGS